jgi:hypothetical protein
MIIEYVIVITIMMVAGFLIFQIMHKKLRTNKELEIISVLSQYGKVVTLGKKHFFEYNQKEIEIVFFYLPMQSELTINSKTMWEVKTMHKSKLINQSLLTSSNHLKWVIIYPSNQPIKRYINENELVFVKPEDTFYNLQMMHADALEQFLKKQ